MPIDLYVMLESTACRIVLMTARQLGVKVNVKLVNLLAGEQMKPEFLAMNPEHNVPLINDNGFYLNESRAICAYLVHKYGKDDTLYPKDAQARALVDQRLYFDACTLYARFNSIYTPILMEGVTEIDPKAKKGMYEAIDFLELFLGKTKYAAGDHLTIADISLMSTASSMLVADKAMFDKHPKIQAWFKTCKAEIIDYEETNQPGIDALARWAHPIVSKLKQ